MALRKNNRTGIGNASPPVSLGATLSTYDYYTSSNPFINLIHGTKSAWAGTGAAYINALGWITDLPSGALTVSKYVILHVQYLNGYVKPGRYIMTWTGPLTVAYSGVGTVTLNTANRVEFTLPALDASNNRGTFLQVTVSNSSGNAGSLSDLAIYHEDDEADFLAGEIFQSDYLHGLGGVKVLRNLLWSAVNDSAVVNYSDIPTEAHCSWSPCPISVFGKLCVKLAADAWICVYHRATDACMRSIFQELYAQGVNRVYVEPTNEAWNTVFSQGEWLRTNIGPTITVVDQNGAPSADPGHTKACATAHLALRSWAAAETYFPRARVVRAYCGQAAVFSSMEAGFEYEDTSDTFYPNQKLKNLVDVYGISAYFGFSGGNYGVPADMSRKAMVTRRDDLEPDKYWSGIINNGLDVVANNYITPSKTNCTSKRADIQLVSYELGQGWEINLASNSGDWSTKNWGATVDLVNNVLDFGADVTGIFSNGDLASYTWGGGSPLFTGGQYYLGYPVRFFPASTSKLRVYPTQAAYDADSGNTGAGAATLSAGDGTWRIDNMTRLLALAARYQALLDSSLAARWYAQYYDMCVRLGMKLFMQFTEAGYSAAGYSETNWFWWGLKRSHWESDNPRSAWFRKFAKG